MKYGVDTSILLRFLTEEPADLSEIVLARLQEIWMSGGVCEVCDLVLSETYYALQHSYKVPKVDALTALKALTANPGFEFSDAAVTALSTPNLAKANPGFLDRVIHGTYITSDNSTMLTCEKDAKKLPNVEVLKV